MRSDLAFARLNTRDLSNRYEQLQELAAKPKGFSTVLGNAKAERNRQQLSQFVGRIRANLNQSAQSVLDEAIR